MNKLLCVFLGITLAANVFSQPDKVNPKKLEKRLEAEMIESPKTQAEIDKNLILQYAIDNHLDVQSTPSGIYYIIEKKGDGKAHPDMNSSITAHYHGSLLDGTVFDSSVDRGQPFTFQLGRVIKGWQEAIPMLTKGAKGKFIIPSGLAYGPQSTGPIQANSVLIFDIELIDFVDKNAEKKRQAEADKALILDYLKKNNLDAQSTASGIYYIIEKQGDGKGHPDVNSQITAHYHGTLLNGTVFDSSVDRGQPITFRLNQVIKGWQEAIPLLTKGAKGKFIIPSGLAYGPRGAGKDIGQNAVLVFTIELIDFSDER
jgi:FKBP-type peptidyl-prolyl cis-trans isomerase FkpA